MRDGYPKYRDGIISLLKSCLTFYTGPDDGTDDDDEDPPTGQESDSD